MDFTHLLLNMSFSSAEAQLHFEQRIISLEVSRNDRKTLSETLEMYCQSLRISDLQPFFTFHCTLTFMWCHFQLPTWYCKAKQPGAALHSFGPSLGFGTSASSWTYLCFLASHPLPNFPHPAMLPSCITHKMPKMVWHMAWLVGLSQLLVQKGLSWRLTHICVPAQHLWTSTRDLL